MKPIIEIITIRQDDLGSVNLSEGDSIKGMTKREVRIFGLKVCESRIALFAKETRLFSILIKKDRHEGWDVEKDPPTSL